MLTIQVLPDNQKITIPYKSTLLKATLKAGILHQHACGGKGKCSTCRIRIVEGLENCLARTPREVKIADKLKFDENIRLACQTVITGDVSIQRLVVDEIDVEIAQQSVKKKVASLTGQETEATLVFIDIYDFTSFTSQNQPYDVMHLLNRYYYIAGKSILKYGGIILDYYGDGILALFESMKPQNHALNAIHACREFISDFQRLTDYSFLLTAHPFKCRIGIHSGNVIIGMMGMHGFEKLAVVGDEVNVASRIENANKKYGTTVLISEATKQMVNGEVEVVNSFDEKIKGIEEVVRLYELKL